MTLKTDLKNCIICGSRYVTRVSGVVYCRKCGLLFSGQKAGFGNPIQGMRKIAIRNYEIISKALEKTVLIQGSRILDVGCAEGGFTEMMLNKGGDSIGLEPDLDAAKEALSRQLPVKIISFEKFQGTEKSYDIIVFNDVFEHIEDPNGAIKKSLKLLKDNGFILINAPVSSGLIFRVVEIAARFGIESPYKRIWAQGLSSPHIYFYTENNLKLLLAKYNLDLVNSGRLVALETEGMYKRVRSTYGPFAAIIISAVASIFTLISNLTSADVKYFLFKKK